MHFNLETAQNKTPEEKKFLEKFLKEIFGDSLEIVVSREDEKLFFEFFQDIKRTVNKEYRDLGYVNVSESRPTGNAPHELSFAWEHGNEIGEIILKFKAI